MWGLQAQASSEFLQIPSTSITSGAAAPEGGAGGGWKLLIVGCPSGVWSLRARAPWDQFTGVD